MYGRHVLEAIRRSRNPGGGVAGNALQSGQQVLAQAAGRFPTNVPLGPHGRDDEVCVGVTAGPSVWF